jgi:hypothetical protein
MKPLSDVIANLNNDNNAMTEKQKNYLLGLFNFNKTTMDEYIKAYLTALNLDPSMELTKAMASKLITTLVGTK